MINLFNNNIKSKYFKKYLKGLQLTTEVGTGRFFHKTFF